MSTTTVAETFADTCARCGRIETFREPPPEFVDWWTLGPDNWLVILVDWDGYLASWSDGGRAYGQDLVVLHVCPECVTDEDLDEPHNSWRLQSG